MTPATRSESAALWVLTHGALTVACLGGFVLACVATARVLRDYIESWEGNA